jgi:hypothetical protein
LNVKFHQGKHFDAHNHIGGTLDWRGFIMAYLMAAQESDWPHVKADAEEFKNVWLDKVAKSTLVCIT